jgi:hypothetical protein
LVGSARVRKRAISAFSRAMVGMRSFTIAGLRILPPLTLTMILGYVAMEIE